MIRKFTLLALAFFLLGVNSTGSQERPPNAEPQGAFTAAIQVNLRNATGAPLAVPADVQVRQRAGSLSVTKTAQPTEGALFRDLPAGEYIIEVTAAGFQPSSETATLQGGSDISQVFILLIPVSAPASAVAAGPPSLVPKAAKEVQEAVLALSTGDLGDAQKRLERAEKASPGHPEVHYLFGMLQLKRNDTPGARQRFNKALESYPQHVGALGAMGRLQLEEQDFAGAASFLERALVMDGRSAENHSLLAHALFELQQMDKAKFHAEQAVDIAGGRRPDTRLLLAKILIALGDEQQASATLKKLLADYPAHSGAKNAQALLAELIGGPRPEGDQGTVSLRRGSGGTPVEGLGFAPSSEAAPESPVREWAPRDVDETPPAVFRDVPCSITQVMEHVSQRVVDLTNNLRDVNATEIVVHREVDGKGRPGRAESRKYEYMFAIRRAPPNLLWVEEMRNGAFGGDYIAGTLTSGLAAMALIFHPHFVGDFEVRCEGQGNWRGTPVWFLYFQQREDRPGRFYRYKNAKGSEWLPLKGRAWVEANSYQILRLEIGIKEPNRKVELERMQWVIEYGPVEFKNRGGTFWLPASAETFTQARGKRWHRRHTMSDYVHFSVDTDYKIAAPKVPEQPPEDPAKKPPQLQL